MLLKEDQNTELVNLKEIKAQKCVTDDFKLVTNPINNKVALYKKTEKGNWIFVYEDLTIEAINPSTKETLKTAKIPCKGYVSYQQQLDNQTKQDEDNKKKVDDATRKEIEGLLNSVKLTLDKPKVTSGQYGTGIDIRKVLNGQFAKYYTDLGGDGEPIYVYNMSSTDEKNYKDVESGSGVIDGKKAKELLKQVKNSEVSRKDCKANIKLLDYYRSTKEEVDPPTLLSLKKNVYDCYRQGKKFYEGALGVGDEMSNILSDMSKYGISEFLSKGEGINESVNLKDIIKENLIKKSKEKQKVLISEVSVINQRFNLLSEGKKIKTKKDIKLFVNDLIKETAELNALGYKPELIQEGLFDIVKGLFGNASESIFGYFKEQFATWIVEKFTPIETDTWLGSIIVTAIGNIPLSDLPKLTNCSFVSNLIAKSIVEGTAKKIQDERGFDSPGYDILRNALIEMAEDSSFGQKVEQKVSEFICPMLSGMSQKIGSAADTIKQKVVA